MAVASTSLALHGGARTIPTPFPHYNPLGPEEVAAATAVIQSGVLSQYIGAWCPDFLGGPKVREFEQAVCDRFGVSHAITVNSWTSGLIAAIGALDIEPGDEIIVSPWTMCASATAILHWNAIPVFADIERETFCLDPASIEANITPHTRAILAPDIFGHPADMDAIMAIAERHGLQVISDTAQAPGSLYRGKPSGTLAHIGGYSLNYHKHIHTGEGGILVTNDARLAERMQLIRNHAEAVVQDKGVTDLRNMIGHNFRLGEIECAMGIEQLKKLDRAIASRQRAANRLAAGLAPLEGLRPPVVKPDCTHVYYFFPMILDEAVTGVPRARLHEALLAEGITGLGARYQNVHLLPMYQQKIGYGSKGFPWVPGIVHRDVDYRKGICPVAEELQDRSYMGLFMCMSDYTDAQIDLVIEAFHKVWQHRDALR
ncbi:MAG: DegT/DnrJ/EryC1/StrS family aminotransferase [Actinobacteria bacterium]|nr:DegT/DnrJ/EryC1/StrS family aminotransferase [Actinomycetota bacterium]